MEASPKITIEKDRSFSTADHLQKTVSLIGKGIKAGAAYPPLRMHAARIASLAPGRKNYRAQLKALFFDFLRRWRYVRDPFRAETVVTSGPAIQGIVLGGWYNGRGFGDCDDATVALGAMAEAIGLPVRIVVMAGPGKRTAGHVYPEIQLPGEGWIPADPVAYPRTPFGAQPPAQWRARYDVEGNALDYPGAHNPMIGDTMIGETNLGPGYGLEYYGLAGIDAQEPAPWDSVVLGFGAYADTYEPLGGFGLLAEVDTDPVSGLARTPMLEIGLDDYLYLQRAGRPYDGMMALSDTGEPMIYDGIAGFFKKFFRRIGRGLRRVGRRLRKIARKIIKRLPFGKYLVKFGQKLRKIAMKMVKPLMKLIGPLAKKLAPIAALIPGYGPAISVALKTTGKIADLVKKYDVRKGPAGRMKFRTPRHFHAFRQGLKAAAAEERARRRGAKPGTIPAGTPEHAQRLRRIGVPVSQLPPWTV